MRFGKIILIGGFIAACLAANWHTADAQLRRRPAIARARPAQPAAAAKQQTTAGQQNRNLITGKVVQLSPMLPPAAGPSGSQGVASIFYNDVDTTLNSGNLVITGLPAGQYMAWLVFFDPFAAKNIYSELTAVFQVTSNNARVETALAMGLPNVINISHVKQLVITHPLKTTAQVGQAPIAGAVGYSSGTGKGQAVLAANIN